MSKTRLSNGQLQQQEQIWVPVDPRNEQINAIDIALYVLHGVLSGHQVVVGDDEGYQANIVLSGMRLALQAPLRVQAEQDHRNAQLQPVEVTSRAPATEPGGPVSGAD